MLDINTIRRNQILNLMEYGVLVLTTAETVDFISAPDYLIEKFDKYFGTAIKPNATIVISADQKREFHKYCAKWGVSVEEPKLRNIYCFVYSIMESLYSFKLLVQLFNLYFTGTPTNQPYISVHSVTRKDLLDKIITKDTLLTRLLTLTELED